MTAFELIDSIFVRHHAGMPGNERRLTAAQLRYLKDLIGADPEGGAMRVQGPGLWVWTPSGRNKYEIHEDRGGNQHKIVRLANLVSSETGRLF